MWIGGGVGVDTRVSWECGCGGSCGVNCGFGCDENWGCSWISVGTGFGVCYRYKILA